MDFEINIAGRIIILSILGYFLIKLTITALFSLMGPKKRKNNYDLDQMIKRKEDLLRSSSGLQSSKQEAKESAVNYRYEEERLYCQELKKCSPSNDKERFQELTAIVDIFDNANWGQGKSFKSLQEKFFALTHLKLDQSVFSKAVNKLSQEKLFLRLNSAALPGLKELQQMILNFVLITQTEKEVNESSSPLLDKIAKQEMIDLKCLKKAINKHQGNNWELRLFGEKRQSILSPQSTISSWAATARLFEALIPLAPLPKGDLNEAFNRLKLAPSTDMEGTKKRYKNLAHSLHPDKMGHLQLSAEEQKILNDNFSIIQQAFDEIKKAKSTK